VSVTETPIEPGELLDFVSDPAAGAVVTFLGTVRDHSPGKTGVTHLVYEAYLEVVEEKLAGLVGEAARRWPIVAVAVQHRLGRVEVGDPSVGVGVSCAHRSDAFEAARFLIDSLKSEAPIWKQEHWDGGVEWIHGS
jgi:molybdopterin synthase catalytic subunit